MRSGSFKKFVAAFLIVTVIASLGLTAFATNPVDGENSTGEGIVTAEIEITETSTNLYNVAVNYTNNVESSIGVTMLAYTAKEGSLENGDLTLGYNSTDYDIVALDQTDETSSGTFNFIVDTDPNSENPDAIDMEKGEVGIVLLSADGTTAPAAYLFSISAEFVITEITTSQNTITVPFGATNEKIIEELNKLDIIVSGADPTVYEDNWTANWSFPEEFDSSSPGLYTVTGTVVKPKGSYGVLGEVTTVNVDVDVEELSWEATKGTLSGVSIKVDADADEDAIADAVKAALVDKVITITDETGRYSAEVVIDDEIAQTLAVTDGTYKVLVNDAEKATNENPEGSVLTIPAAFYVEFSVNVSYNPTGEFTVESIKAFDASDAEVTEIEVENGTSEADAIAALTAKVAKATVCGVNDFGSDASEDWTVTSWTIEGYVAETAGSYPATATIEAPVGALGSNTNNVTLTVTVKVKGATANVLVGDFNKDTRLNSKDYAWAARWDAGWTGYDQVGSGYTEEEFKVVADVNNDGRLNSKDYATMARWDAGWAGYETLPLPKQ